MPPGTAIVYCFVSFRLLLLLLLVFFFIILFVSETVWFCSRVDCIKVDGKYEKKQRKQYRVTTRCIKVETSFVWCLYMTTVPAPLRTIQELRCCCVKATSFVLPLFITFILFRFVFFMLFMLLIITFNVKWRHVTLIFGRFLFSLVHFRRFPFYKLEPFA